ncbi:MAG: Pvc16 family protein, partial [Bacteroidota bacterium]
LYVLFAFNPGDSNLLYEKALLLLSVVLRYFHSNPSQEVQITNGGQQETYKLTVSYHNISLEDSNNMWSNLGGTQKPYAMYKMQLVEIVPTRNPALAPVLQNPVVMTGSTNQTMN